MDDPFAADLARKSAAPFPWETDPDTADPFAADMARKGMGAEQEDRIGRANRQFAQPMPTLPTPGVLDSLKQMGSTIAGGVSAIGHIAAHPSTLADPHTRRELERGVSDAVTAGLAERAARAVDPEAFGPQAAAADAEAAPGVRVGGAVAGSFLPSPARFVASKVGGIVPGTGALPGAARAVAQYEATAPAMAAIQAEPGRGAEAAFDAATDPASLMLSGGIGAAAGVAPAATRLLQKKAENRMVDQAIKDIAGSRETGLSKPTDRRAIARVIEPIKEELRQPDGIKIADTARKDPARAWEMVKKKVDSLSADRTASYAAVDAETGGVRVKELRRFLASEAEGLGKEPGQVTERQAVEAMMKDIDETWGQQLAPTIPTMKLRQYVTRLQRVAADTMGGLEETRRVQILDHVSGLAKDFLDQHLNDAAKADSGLRPVVEGLREQNRRVSAWLSLEDALKTRAGKLETNNMVDNKPKVLAGGAAAAAAAAHFLHSPTAAAVAGGVAVAPYVLPPIDRAVTRAAAGMTAAPTLNPSAVARLIQASRAGASRPDLRAQAERDGLPVEIADNIAQQSGR